MRVFLINLDSAPERLLFMKGQLDRLGIEFERISAVDGRLLPRQELSRQCNFFLQWCCRGKTLNPGEVGCAMSHIKIWRRIIEENIPYACILEDDVTVLDNMKLGLEKLEALVKDHDTAFCYMVSCGRDDGEEPFRLIPSDIISNMCGYIVSRKAAELLLVCNMPIVYVCDAWKVWRYVGLKHYNALPRLVGHWNRSKFGTMNTDYVVDERISAVSNLVHKAKRCLGWPIKRLFDLILLHRVSRLAKKWGEELPMNA